MDYSILLYILSTVFSVDDTTWHDTTSVANTTTDTSTVVE